MSVVKALTSVNTIAPTLMGLTFVPAILATLFPETGSAVQMSMSVRPALTTVPTTARTHLDLTLVAARLDTSWTKMDSLAMKIMNVSQ